MHTVAHADFVSNGLRTPPAGLNCSRFLSGCRPPRVRLFFSVQPSPTASTAFLGHETAEAARAVLSADRMPAFGPCVGQNVTRGGGPSGRRSAHCAPSAWALKIGSTHRVGVAQIADSSTRSLLNAVKSSASPPLSRCPPARKFRPACHRHSPVRVPPSRAKTASKSI